MIVLFIILSIMLFVMLQPLKNADKGFQPVCGGSVDTPAPGKVKV